MRAAAVIATPATDAQAGLRREIRELGVLLGRTLVRQEGQELLNQVERIRHLIRADRDSAAALLADVEPSDATKLVRAFTTYFHLANVAEQVYRGRELADIRARDGSWLSQAVDRIAAAEIPRSEIEPEVRRLAVRPVFTAHPTEAARRTVLYKLRQIAELLDGAHARVTARLEETVDLLWQTDELRIAKPDVVDEARNAVWYLDGLHADAVPHVLEELAEELGRLGLELAPDARPLAFGTWIGGDRDGNPNVRPDATGRVLDLPLAYVAFSAIAGGVAGLIVMLVATHWAGMIAALLVFAASCGSYDPRLEAEAAASGD